MNQDFFDALQMLEKERGVPAEYMLEKIRVAIGIAIKKDPSENKEGGKKDSGMSRNYVGSEDSIVDIDPANGRFYVAMRKKAVEDVENPRAEIWLFDAVKYKKDVQIGDIVEIPLDPKTLSRIAAKAAKDVIRQAIRESEKQQLLKEYQSRLHDIITATVLKTDMKRGGNVTLEIGSSEAILPKAEQVPNETFKDGQRIRVYVVDVIDGEKGGPRLMISRTHPGLVKRLFEMEVPEIYDGVVEIQHIAREAGSRSKLAVSSRDENVDAVGACIGPKGSRVSQIVEELGGEKIDVVKYSEDPVEFISAALSPATVLKVEIIDKAAKSCRVTVPDQQLSLAIGNKGQNARLAAKLTGWKIDIRPESEAEAEPAPAEEPAAVPEEAAEAEEKA